jgi:Kef-type K+ transport system membrane component KefB/CBS domain-containing protein
MLAATESATLNPGLLFGLMLLSAIVGGYAARLIHFPRVVGFVLGGVGLNYLLSWVPDGVDATSRRAELEAAAEPLQAIKDLALGLILFTIGSVFERSRIRAAGWRVFKITLTEVVVVLVTVFVGCAVVSLVASSADTQAEHFIMAILLASAAIATAPAATLFVLQEYEAKGPVTDATLTLTGANNIICIVLFHALFLVLASSGAIETTGNLAQHLWLTLAAITLGSVALGVVAGMMISILHAKLQLSETLLIFFAVFALLGAGEQWLWLKYGVSFSFLLTTLVMGAVFANVAIDSQKLEATLRTIGKPVFVGFFVIAGFGLHIDDLAHMGWLGAAYILCIFLGKTLGCYMGVRWAGVPARAGWRLGPALLCQAAVQIGLASFVDRYWASDLAGRFVTVILCSVVVFELIGPLLVKRCVVQAGEVKAMTLLGRVGTFTEGTSVTRLALESFGRLVGWRFDRSSIEPEALCVRHIMRTNVQFIPAAATFDEVLHDIERSTYSHFPVVNDAGEFVGVIHFSDVHDVIYDPSLSALVTAIDLADPASDPVPQNLPLRDALDRFREQNVGALPVVDHAESKRVVGLVEQRDLLRALHLSQDT